MKRTHFVLALAFCLAVSAKGHAQAKVSTCIAVEAPAAEKDGLSRLVASEVDRHPSHRATNGACDAHLRVELIEVSGDRFLTGRVGGEVPDRVRVQGKTGAALEAAVGELLRIVLGNDPVVLRAPGGQSWFASRMFELKSEGRNTLDVMAVETAHLVSGHVTFLPGLSLGFTREVAAWQIGVEGLVAQGLEAHPGRADLNTEVRLQLATAFFFSSDADVSGFAGASFGLAYQRFSGPRAADVGGGDGVYDLAGPVLGLRAGVEVFRTTTTRLDVLAEALIPLFVGNDKQNEIFEGWTPSLTLGGGARF